jgi:pimeloyl-ACP methyl ester carboxylesterase
MIHAGVADSRQWNNEFRHFARNYKVLRYDMRGYGKSEPAEGDFNHMLDLEAVLEALEIRQPIIMMGCSMGGGLAIDFALEHPSSVRALITVGSGPSGLALDLPESPKYALAENAWKDGDVDLTAELETQIWFDGEDRTPEQVDPGMRMLALEMDRQALRHEARKLGNRQPNSSKPAFDRLQQLGIPVLIIVGAQDQPYSHASAAYMMKHIPSARMVAIEDAAHLPNMEHPEEFRTVVEEFLRHLPD